MNGVLWEARGIQWHARAASVVSDDRLTAAQGACAAGARCDYGVGTHTYRYDPDLAFPASPWRDLPTLVVDDPDDLPIAP